MKLRGKIENKEVIVMVDPRATHNILSLAVVKLLELPIEESGGFGVSLGNGEMIKGNGVCRGVNVHLDGKIVVCEDFLPLELGTSDVILGIQWLETLGPVTTNWKTRVMDFKLGESIVTLKGDPSLIKSRISLKAMLRSLRKEGKGYWVEFKHLTANKAEVKGINKQDDNISGALQRTIQQFAGVFAEPDDCRLLVATNMQFILRREVNQLEYDPIDTRNAKKMR